MRVRPGADGLGEWCSAEAGDGGMVTLGSAVTLPTFGHMLLSFWTSPDGSSERAEAGLFGSKSTILIAIPETSHQEVG